MKLPSVNITSILRLCLMAVLLLPVAVVSATAQDAAGYRLPQLRKPQLAAAMPALPPDKVLRLLADQDFPPFSFAARSGEPAGLSTELALAACAEIKVKCEVLLKPLPSLLGALASGEGDVIVSGLRIDEQVLGQALMTRPWFRSMGRFAALSGSPLQSGDGQSLAAKRLGAISGTLHAEWLERNFTGSTIVQFQTEAMAQEALRVGKVEALFGDNLRLIYWITGANSRGCCKLLSGAHSDTESFSRSFAFLMRRDSNALRDAFDLALDRLQLSGATEKIFNVYVPLSPW